MSDFLVCLSLAATLRCPSLSNVQEALLLIAPIFALVISLFLPAGNLFWRRSLKSWPQTYWLLVGEGVTYVALAIVDLISHLDHPSLTKFMVIDQAIGGLSFLPAVLYILFLTAFLLHHILPSFPSYLRLPIKYFLLLFVFMFALSNDLASLLGVTYGTVPSNPSAQQNSIAIGYSSAQEQSTSRALSQLTLGLLVAAQLVFVLSCALHTSMNHVEDLSVPRSTRGLIVVTLGAVVGIGETVIGLSAHGFTGLIVRKAIYMLSRLLVTIGVLLWMHDVASRHSPNMEKITPVNVVKTRGLLAGLISDPRLSTFQQLSPSARNFHDAHKQTRSHAMTIPTDPFASSSSPAVDNTRVVVRYSGWTRDTPQLDVRFSALDIPSAKTIIDSFEHDPSFNSPPPLPSSRRSLDGATHPPHKPRPAHLSLASSSSAYPISRAVSLASVNSFNSLAGVRDIAGRFPPLPTSIHSRSNPSLPLGASAVELPYLVPTDVSADPRGPVRLSTVASTTPSRSSSMSSRRKPVPIIPHPSTMPQRAIPTQTPVPLSAIGVSSRHTHYSSYETVAYSSYSIHRADSPTTFATTAVLSPDHPSTHSSPNDFSSPAHFITSPNLSISGRLDPRRSHEVELPLSATHQAEAQEPQNTEIKMAVKKVFEKSEGNIQKARQGMRLLLTESAAIPAIVPIQLTTEERDFADHFGTPRNSVDTAGPRAVSTVRVRTTPTPVSGFERDSVAVEMGDGLTTPRSMAYDEGNWLRPNGGYGGRKETRPRVGQRAAGSRSMSIDQIV